MKWPRPDARVQLRPWLGSGPVDVAGRLLPDARETSPLAWRRALTIGFTVFFLSISLTDTTLRLGRAATVKPAAFYRIRSGSSMRILHTMLRVGDLDASIVFYTQVLGMTELRRKDYPEGRFTNAFVGYQPESEGAVLELTYNWDHSSYDLGDGYGHVALAVDDVYAACERIREKGGRITREPGPMKHGTTVLAFAQDPDGYKIELLGRE